MVETSCHPGREWCHWTHFRYRTWPVDLRLPATFHDGTWPTKAQPRQMRLWCWARSKGLIRMEHL